MTTFGKRMRQLRLAKGLSQKRLAALIGVHHTYLSKAESGKLDYAPYPGEDLVKKLAVALDADVDELMLLAEKIPDEIKRRVIQRPDAFRKLARLDDKILDLILVEAERLNRRR